jgi:hypothetical protein
MARVDRVPLKKGYAPVAFDELAWQEDLRRASKSTRRIGSETRSRLEREGQAVDSLFACDDEARDGTSLPGCVKVYIPPPGGPLGHLDGGAQDALGLGIGDPKLAAKPVLEPVARCRRHGQS